MNLNKTENQEYYDLTIQVKTPAGYTNRILDKWGFILKRFLLGNKHKVSEVEVKDNCILWTVKTNLSGALNIQKRLAMYESLVSGMFHNKLLQKAIGAKFTPEQRKEVEDLLINHTEISII